MEWRPVARRLLSGWRIIALTTAVAVLVAAGITLADPYRYASEAYVAVAKPETVLQFDERFAAPESNPAFPYQVNSLRTYGELARTPALAETVAARLEGTWETVPEPEALLRLVDVEAMADGALLVIRARAKSPEAAASLANLWAEAFSEQMADVFGAAGEDHPVKAARLEAEDALAAAEDELNEFHSTSPLPALEAEVSNLGARQRRLLEAVDKLTAVERDLAALRQRALGTADADLADRVAALTLQLNALTSGSGAPIDLDMAAGGLDVRVGPSDLDGLEALVAASRRSLDEEIASMPEQLAQRTADLEREKASLARLERARQLAEERYMTLARKSDELDVARETSRPELRVAAAATVPEGMDLSALAYGVLAALAVGALGGAVLVLAYGARAGSRPEPTSDGE